MRQITFAGHASFEKFSRPRRRERFLYTAEEVVPWSELEALIDPCYPKEGKGRQPAGLSIMLRIYFLQQWFSLSDPGAEDALYESPVLPRFTGVDLGRTAAPYKSVILNFRHLPERHQPCGKILDAVNRYLASKGVRISTGAIVDATLIAAPSSTKNSSKERDPEMHRTKKGNQYCFGAKAHIGVDSKEGVDEEQKRKSHTKSRVRAKVEWPFRILDRVFKFTKVRYRQPYINLVLESMFPWHKPGPCGRGGPQHSLVHRVGRKAAERMAQPCNCQRRHAGKLFKYLTICDGPVLARQPFEKIADVSCCCSHDVHPID